MLISSLKFICSSFLIPTPFVSNKFIFHCTTLISNRRPLANPLDHSPNRLNKTSTLAAMHTYKACYSICRVIYSTYIKPNVVLLKDNYNLRVFSKDRKYKNKKENEYKRYTWVTWSTYWHRSLSILFIEHCTYSLKKCVCKKIQIHIVYIYLPTGI